ncbi:hypothetical protein B1R32_10740 [Abditibacterium utsteinense]|uniref:Uncharacterized protein n=1 Tax=Abditibacterium utsteinense TaxID=1960156 RepID=A0A2S8ST90_9BACT|nr:hypothetical protein [Abditibacterium utsteinense]PQV64015.1 hypothetical protein B1R32_10740 [Abditibacterium utsteinense]
MKILILIVILFFAVGIAMALLTRLTQTQKKIADLHGDLKRNDLEIARQRRELERLSAAQAAQNLSPDDEREIKS